MTLKQSDTKSGGEWGSKESETLFASITRHNRSVAFVKRVLIVITLLLIGVLILWPIVNPVEKHLKLSFGKITEGEAGKPQMLYPKFQGIDEQGQPYKIYADVATQEQGEKVHLNKITGDITLKDGGWVRFSSDAGTVEVKKGLANLIGAVSVQSSNQYTMQTENVAIDFKKTTAVGDVPVTIDGPMGTLEATGFVLDGNAGTIEFSGPVKAVIQSKQLQKGL